MPGRRATWIFGFAAVCLGSVPMAWAGSLVGLLDDPRLEKLELSALGPVLANTVASTYPVASASSSVTYVYNPALDTFERQSGVAGPIIGERADTIGRGQLNLTTSYSYVHLTTINGEDLDQLVNQPTVNGQAIVFPVPGGVTAKEKFTNFLPVKVVADLNVKAHIFTPSVTYGLTPDLDVNLTVPLIHTSLAVTADTQVPDPRFPQYALPPGDPNATSESLTLSDGAYGVGDVLLRAKYVFLRGSPVDMAVGLGVKLPTGSKDDFQGTGDTRVAPALIVSRVFVKRFQPLFNLGIDYNANDVSRSIITWALGTTAQIVDPLTAALVFFGRHELAAQADPIENPFFFQIERNDIFDSSVGFRYRFAGSGIVSANAIVPLNEQGLRAAVIPTIEVEYAF